MKKLGCIFILFSLSISFSAFAALPDGAVYIDGGESKSGLVLAHGQGKHPTWLVVEPVRKGINQKLGYHTISLQMPTGNFSDWKDYAGTFRQAYSIIEGAVTFLKNEKGVSNIYLFGHSMGSRMSSAFVNENSANGLAGLIVAGCRNNGGRPLACDKNLVGIKLPVLDIWGGASGKDTDAASERKRFVSNNYTQKEIAGADHVFDGYEDALVDAVVAWLKQRN